MGCISLPWRRQVERWRNQKEAKQVRKRPKLEPDASLFPISFVKR
jgi:hypothetical protein